MDREIKLTDLELQVLKFACERGSSFEAVDALGEIADASFQTVSCSAGTLISYRLMMRPGRDSRQPDRFKITKAGSEWVEHIGPAI